jgi:hypothetical protein
VRDPLEVCVSLLEQRPGWLRDAGSRSHLLTGLADPQQDAPEEYLPRLFAGYCRAALRLDAKRGKLIPYETLPQAVWDKLAPHFGLAIGDEAKSRMASASGTYAKSRVGQSAAFVPDGPRKRAAASPELRRAVDAYARPELERLVAALA